ncbi:MAG: class I SAM-dependent methyltransferase [Acidobacteria bacterium]|nr:class I SAM-dependent methyltransferase [Acidobacteriota bacterium]
MLFPSRQTSGSWLRSADEAPHFDRYLESRNRYKDELITELAASVTDGPVLEVGNGFGAVGIELLRRTTVALFSVCESHFARDCYAERLRRHGLFTRCRLSVHQVGSGQPLPWPAGRFELVFAVNSLHEWQRPGEVLPALYRLACDGGSVVLNDLRRDADPFITEYVLREMAADTTPEGRYRARTFVRSLAAAYSAEEVRRLLADADFPQVEVDDGDAMTLTLRIRKQV